MPNVAAARSEEAPFTLGLLLFEGCMPAGLFAVADLLRAANLRAGRELMRWRWLTVDGQAVSGSEGGPTLTPEGALSDNTQDLDALLLPGLWVSSLEGLQQTLQARRAEIAALRALPARCALWSYCAGVPLLADSGRLHGRPATATWWLAPHLQALFPQVAWQFGEALVEDESGKAVTAAGANGYLALMLDQLSRRMEAESLREVQEVLMLPQPRQRHPSFASVSLMALREPWLRELLLWAQRMPAMALTVPAAAAALKLSSRTLSRHVQAATGLPAASWLRRVKLRQVAERLARGPEPLKRLAEDLGFSTEAALHRMFKQTTGLTPQGYRGLYRQSA
ncbi:MAG: helix-turn-helix domain-containing protein [Paucibacter sp.]|nr:helix-turn-helix domain-containing protein [Roseateles sp.]